MNSTDISSDLQNLNLLEELLGEVSLYLKLMNIDNLECWRNDGLNENHNYLRLVKDGLKKIDKQQSKFSDRFKLEHPEFIESMDEIAHERSVNMLNQAGLRFFLDQEIPDAIKYLKTMYSITLLDKTKKKKSTHQGQ